MSIQPQHVMTPLDQVALSAVMAGMGLMVGVVLGIVIGVHLVHGRTRSASTSSAPLAIAAPAPAVVREVVRETVTVREVPAGHGHMLPADLRQLTGGES